MRTLEPLVSRNTKKEEKRSGQGLVCQAYLNVHFIPQVQGLALALR